MTNLTYNFTGKTALVTGGSRGIGREIATQFAQAGANVIIHCGSNQSAAESTLASLPLGNHQIMQADLADVGQIEQMVSQLERIDVLVNNAGIFVEHPIAAVDFEAWRNAWDQVIAVNLVGAAHLSYLCGQKMIAQGGGRIVNVSSRGAFRGEPKAPAYGASKAGMNAMAQSLAQALAPHNVFVHTVAPGFVETDMAAEKLAGPEGDGIRNQSPLGRVALPSEVASAVLYCACEETAFMTGCIIDVNGASYLRT